MKTMRREKLDIAAARSRLGELRGREYWRSMEELLETEDFREHLHREFRVPIDSGFDRRELLALMGASLPVQGGVHADGELAFTNTSSLRVAGHLPARNFPLAYDGGQTTLVSPIDPDYPSLVVTLPRTAPLPIEIVALDLVGTPVGEPITVMPGSIASLAQSTAAAYVARTPFLAAARRTTPLACPTAIAVVTLRAKKSCSTARTSGR